jgi:hypothetical protein
VKLEVCLLRDIAVLADGQRSSGHATAPAGEPSARVAQAPTARNCGYP